MRNPLRYFNRSPEVIRLAAMMYIRYPLSLRQLEDLPFERGIDICHETVRARPATPSRHLPSKEIRRLGICGQPARATSPYPQPNNNHIPFSTKSDGRAQFRYADSAFWSFSVSMVCSRITNFCTLPVTVIGNASTNTT